MTKVRLDISEFGLVYTLTVHGHAEHGGANGDIVCAACSIVVQGLCRALAECDDLITGYRVREDEAWMEVRCALNDSKDETAKIRRQSMYDMAMTCYRMLAEEYPQNVRLAED